MKTARRWIALCLTVLFLFSFGTPVSAAENGGTPYPAYVRVIDRALGVLHDVLFRDVQHVLRALFPRSPIPSIEEYAAQAHPELYPGTDGTVRGSGWAGGYAFGSIIPTQWRRNARGEPDPQGYCLDKTRATGGYPYVLQKIYTDQQLSVLILSNHSDSGGNGVDDILVFVSFDGIGPARGTVKRIRAEIEKALAPFGVEKEDILVCEVSASHCHLGLDTQGMAFRRLELLRNGLKTGRSLDPVMENTIVSCAADCAKEAYAKMENGELTYFETAPVDGASDKLDSGVRTQNRFACFLFTGESGEKTVLANIAAHPTHSYKAQELFAEYPYWMHLAMQELGYNFLFVQSAQANINGPGMPTGTDEARIREAVAWADAHGLSREDWIERFGKAYTDKYYADHDEFNEQTARDRMADAYVYAQMILDAFPSGVPVAPSVEVRVSRTLLPLDYGIMTLACVTGLLGEDTVIVPGAETGYGVMAEINYIALGDDIVILTAPGELSPSLAYGTDPDYTGDALWTGKTSWAGKDWPYDTLENLVRKATGDPDKTVLIFGITNDALAYVYPDICCTQSMLGAFFFYKVNGSAMLNCMMLTTGVQSGSHIMKDYMRLIRAD